MNITNSMLSSICFLYCPLAQQKHDSKKVPLIRSKKGQREWKLVGNGRYRFFVCNLSNEKLKPIIESRFCWLRGSQSKQFTSISGIIIAKVNIRDKEKQFWEILLKWEKEFESFKLFNLKTVNFTLTNSF